MKAWNLLIVVLVGFVGLSVSDRVWAENHPIVNGSNRVWEVEYGADESDQVGAEREYHAARLLVRSATETVGATSDKLIATLYRFGKPASGKYPPLTEVQGGKLELVGQVAKATKQGNHWKRGLLPFALVGVYTDDKNVGHVVKVRGTYYSGKNNKGNSNGRSDDRVSFTIKDESLSKPPTPKAVQRLLDELLQLMPEGTEDAKRMAIQNFAFAIFGMFGGTVPCDDVPPMDAAEEAEVPIEEAMPVYDDFVYDEAP